MRVQLYRGAGCVPVAAARGINSSVGGMATRSIRAFIECGPPKVALLSLGHYYPAKVFCNTSPCPQSPCPLCGTGGRHHAPARSPDRNTSAHNPHALGDRRWLAAPSQQPMASARAAPSGEVTGATFLLFPLPAFPVPTTPSARWSARSSRFVLDRCHVCALRSTALSAVR